MHKRARQWSISAWIACLAILFNAFAPIASHASASGAGARPGVEMEVCTALGMEMKSVPMALEQSRQPASDPDRLHKNSKHCGFCVAPAASHGLPPPMAVMFAAVGGRDVYPPLYYHSSRPLFPWSLAQPRAPPALA
jgi:hypothetical protein